MNNYTIKIDLENSCAMYWLPQTTTTQDASKEILMQTGDNSVVAVAGSQTNGRGRSGRKWISEEEGNLYMSIAFSNAQITDWNCFPLVLPVCISDAIALSDHATLRYKWPNDLLINNKKVGGILIEKNIIGNRTILVVGVGLNIWLTPKVPDIIPTSFAQEGLLSKFLLQNTIPTGQELSMIMLDIANKISKAVNDSIAKVQKGEIKSSLDKWNNLCWKKNGDEITIKIGSGKTLQGIFRYVDSDGGLVMDSTQKDVTNVKNEQNILMSHQMITNDMSKTQEHSNEISYDNSTMSQKFYRYKFFYGDVSC